MQRKVKPVQQDPVRVTSYVWDTAASLPVIVQETTNGATTSYVYGLDLLSATDNSGVTTYFLQDGLGSTTGLTNASGTVTDTYTYDVFGATKTHGGTPGTSTNAWKFTGELNDTTVARSPYYLRARYYDPALGRFTSRDPFAGFSTIPQSLNRYPYVLNNPALYTDPYGYFPGISLPSFDDVKDTITDAGGAVADGVQWVGDDYHWVTVAEVGGSVAFVAGLEIVTAGTATPLVAGVGGTLMAGGLGVGVTATAIDLAHKAKACREGDVTSCVEAGVTAVTAPFGYCPGMENLAISLIGPVFGYTADYAADQMDSGKSGGGQQSLMCTPSKE